MHVYNFNPHFSYRHLYASVFHIGILWHEDLAQKLQNVPLEKTQNKTTKSWSIVVRSLGSLSGPAIGIVSLGHKMGPLHAMFSWRSHFGRQNGLFLGATHGLETTCFSIPMSQFFEV